MKTAVMAVAVAVALLAATPALADECAERLSALSERLAADDELSEERKNEIKELIAEAMEANEAGDEETCMAAVEDAEALIEG